jgi:hypothetical protein
MTAPRALLAALLTLAIGLVGIPAATASPTPSYIAVIDAGSNSTRLSLYAAGSGVTVTRVYRSPASTPGLSSFAADTAAAGPDAVQPLLDGLREHLGGEGVDAATVPVALLATAGMRRVKLDDPVAAREILASTRAALTASGFPLKANRILPDTQEGLLAWLDANANAGTLDAPGKDIGIVEVGGASAQVAFRSPRPSGPGVSTVRVNGRDLHAVAVSYLGLGNNESRTLMQRKTSGGGSCFPNNASGMDPVDYLSTSSMPVNSAQANYRGSPCGRAYADVISEVARSYPREVRPRNLRSLAGFTGAHFVGLGTPRFVYSDFAIPAEADDRRALQVALRTTCKGDDAWIRVRALFPAGSAGFAETQCSSGAYLNQLFFGPTGIGLDPARFDARATLPGGDPSWPAGYAITALHP